MSNIYKICTCSYCDDEYAITRPSPFMGDISAMMCETCWTMTREEYKNSEGTDIGEFENGEGHGETQANFHDLVIDKTYSCNDCDMVAIVSMNASQSAKCCPVCKSEEISLVMG